MNAAKQSGAALITALMFLVILTMLALSSMTSTTLEERMAANSAESNRVFQVAETGLSVAFADPRSYSMRNTETNPYTRESSTIGINTGNATFEYQSIFRQQTEPPRQTGYEAGKAAAFHFNLRSEATSAAGTTSTLNQGAFQIGPKG